MQYLVSMDYIDPGPLLSLEQLASVGENQTFPHLEACVDLSHNGKIRGGGVVAGGRKLLFIIDVESNDELDKLLQALSAWAVTKTEITPLQDFAKRLEQNRQIVERWKAPAGEPST